MFAFIVIVPAVLVIVNILQNLGVTEIQIILLSSQKTTENMKYFLPSSSIPQICFFQPLKIKFSHHSPIKGGIPDNQWFTNLCITGQKLFIKIYVNCIISILPWVKWFPWELCNMNLIYFSYITTHITVNWLPRRPHFIKTDNWEQK